jgi:hypothetical protein
MNKEKLWIIGLLIFVFGIFLLSLFFLSNEESYFFSDSSHFAGGFLIAGSIVLFLGFLFTIICLNYYEGTDSKIGNTIKIRVFLTIVTTTYLVLIGYLMFFNHEPWEFKALIIEDFDQIFAFYPNFSITSYDVIFATLIVFGIFVLPFVINELGLLDSYPDKQLEDLIAEGQKSEKVKNHTDRSAVFLKRRFDTIKKIKNYILPMGVTITTLGCCFMVLPYFFFKDSPQIPDVKTGELFRETYQGLLRGQFFLMGILFLVIGIFFIRSYLRYRRH